MPGCASRVRADQIISGTVINIIALGLTGYLNRLIKPSGSAGTFDTFQLPAELYDLPARRLDPPDVPELGPDHDVGDHLRDRPPDPAVPVALGAPDAGRRRAPARPPTPSASTSSGCATGTSILGGIFAGLAGAWLTLEFNASFQNGMSANRGFIALAAVIFGRWTPIGAFGGALLFMVSEALGIAIRSNPPPGDLGVFLSGIQASYPSIYNNFFGALPYLLTLIVLAGVVGRSIPPAAVGRPYVKEGAS